MCEIDEMYEKVLRRVSNFMAVALALADEQVPKVPEPEKSGCNKPLMVIGPSAVGKDTMINRLKAKYPKVIYKLPSYTTRPKREGETDGVDYYFVTKEEFFQLRDDGELFGIQEYNGNWYASNKTRLEEALKNENKVTVLNYNINTANAVKDEISFNFVAVLPPSEAALKERLIKRKTKAEEIEKRMENSIKEIQLINGANYIQYRLVNDKEEEAYNELERHLQKIYPQLH